MRIHKFHVFSRFWPIVPPTSRPAGVLRPWAARPHLTRYSGPRRGGQYGGGSAVRVFSHLQLRLRWVAMRISCFPPNYFPQRPSRGRATDLGGPAASPQARRPLLGWEVWRAGMMFAFFLFAVAPAISIGRRCGFHVFCHLFSPPAIPRACRGSGWSGRMFSDAAGPAGPGSMAGASAVCVLFLKPTRTLTRRVAVT